MARDNHRSVLKQCLRYDPLEARRTGIYAALAISGECATKFKSVDE